MRLLSDPLPLHSTTELPQYREARPLPWVYGRARVAAIPLDEAGLYWLIAGHPITAVTGVVVDDQSVTGWQYAHTVYDGVGTVATLRLTQAPKSGAPIVSVVGKRDPDTGAALEHPSDIVRDILRECGWSLDPGALDELRTDYPGLALAGALDSPRSVREVLREIMQSIGARWSAMPLDARRGDAWPDPTHTLTQRELIEASASADTDGLATVLRVSYAHDPATGQPRASMALRAPEAADVYGSIEADVALPWVRTARDALAVATAYLQQAARPVWAIQARMAEPDRPISPGDVARIDHPWLPAGDALVESVDIDEAGTLSLQMTMPACAAPYVELVSRSAAVDPSAPDPLRVVYRDGTATFVIADDAGSPIAGASVTLDGTQTRTTDRQGRVQFLTTRGAHTLTVVAPGMAPMEIEVTV